MSNAYHGGLDVANGVADRLLAKRSSSCCILGGKLTSGMLSDEFLFTFGNVKADVLADKDPRFQHINFYSVIRTSQWEG